MSIRDRRLTQVKGLAKEVKKIDSLKPLVEKGLPEEELRLALNYDWLFVYPPQMSVGATSGDNSLSLLNSPSSELERYYIKKDNSLYVLLYEGGSAELYELNLNVIKYSS